MDSNHVFPKFVITTNTLLLWEREIRNQEGVRLIPEITGKEDLEKLQNLLQHRKIKLKNKNSKKAGEIFSGLFYDKLKLIIFQKYFQEYFLVLHLVAVGFHHHQVHFLRYHSMDFLMTEPVLHSPKHFQECHLMG